MSTLAQFNAAALGLVSADQIADDTTLGLIKSSADILVDAGTGVATVATGTEAGNIPRIDGDGKLILPLLGKLVFQGSLFGTVRTVNIGIGFTADADLSFPVGTGTLALTSDIPTNNFNSISCDADGYVTITTADGTFRGTFDKIA